MPTVSDVAAYILKKCRPMTAMKLQKLVYYCQAWSLVWDERPLFGERVEAWANGPVVLELYDQHRGMFKIDHSLLDKGDERGLDDEAVETVDAVLKFYGKKSSQWLSDLTHSEDPWREARRGLAPGQRGDREITHGAMMEYYSGLS